jgi:hypothetical protein
MKWGAYKSGLDIETYTKLSREAVCYGKKVYRRNGKRIVLQYIGLSFDIEYAFWNFYHPDDPLQANEIIKFEDGNRENLDISNLSKHKKTYTPKPKRALSEYDREYLEFCKEAIQYGKQSMSKGRRYLYYKGKSIAIARALWNLWHPEDPVRITEVIHHKDGDRLNDSYENLQKIEAGKHMKLHVEERRENKKMNIGKNLHNQTKNSNDKP